MNQQSTRRRLLLYALPIPSFKVRLALPARSAKRCHSSGLIFFHAVISLFAILLHRFLICLSVEEATRHCDQLIGGGDLPKADQRTEQA